MPPKPSSKPAPVAKKPEPDAAVVARLEALEERLARLEVAVRAGLGLNF